MDWIFHFAILFVPLAILDWAAPIHLRLTAVGRFKRTPEARAAFYSKYRAGFRRRLALLFVLSLLGMIVLGINISDEIQAPVVVGVIALHGFVTIRDAFRAEPPAK